MVSRGASAGRGLAAAPNAVGNIQLLQISAGAVTRVGQLDLGDGIDDIPWTLAVQP